MKLVAVSQRVDYITEYDEFRDALDQRLIDFIVACNGHPIPVPNTLIASGMLDRWLDCVLPDAVVLSGGNDIGKSLDRDNTERRLLDYAAGRALPVLGICRGMQMMGVWAGESLKSVVDHVRSAHLIAGLINQEVNSYHEFSLLGVPEGFVELARSLDGELEAIRHNDLPWEGWMWHPERGTPSASWQVLRYQSLLNSTPAKQVS